MFLWLLVWILRTCGVHLGQRYACSHHCAPWEQTMALQNNPPPPKKWSQLKGGPWAPKTQWHILSDISHDLALGRRLVELLEFSPTPFHQQIAEYARQIIMIGKICINDNTFLKGSTRQMWIPTVTTWMQVRPLSVIRPSSMRLASLWILRTRCECWNSKWAKSHQICFLHFCWVHHVFSCLFIPTTWSRLCPSCCNRLCRRFGGDCAV